MNRRVSQLFIEKALAGMTLLIHGKDEALDFTHVEDVAKGFVLAATKDSAVGETFNITSGHAHTLLEYVLTLKEFLPNVKYEIVERDGSKPQRGTLSIQKAEQLLGFKPDYDLRSGIRAYLESIRDFRSSHIPSPLLK